jgi:putative ATPase
MTVCFIDEIHRFSRVQQDALLAPVEEGVFTLIGATTENPYVSLVPALLSRVTVIELAALSAVDLGEIVRRGATHEKLSLSESLVEILARSSHGDGRRALSLVEFVAARAKAMGVTSEDGPLELRHLSLDPEEFRSWRGTDATTHFELTSAMIKSMRDSDVTAALYWLARLLVAGEDPRFLARRIAVFASEDIGPKNNQALAVANATFAIVERLGMPEAQVTLAHAVMTMASLPKSRLAYNLVSRALEEAQRTQSLGVPEHLRGGIRAVEERRGRVRTEMTEAHGSGGANLPPEVSGQFLSVYLAAEE